MSIYPETNRTMLERVIAGDEIGWEEFFGTYAPVVRSLCRCSNVPEPEIDDVVQEVMCRFAKVGGKFEYHPERARFRTYFNKIVRGAIADALARIAKRDRIARDAESIVANEVQWDRQFREVWQESLLQEILKELKRRVSSRNYLAFTMSFFENRSIAETASFLKISTAQVYLARSRCSAILRSIIRRCNNADSGMKLKFPEKRG